MLVEAERLMITDFIPAIMQHLNINIIYGIVLEENKTSHKVLEKCDFRLDYIGIGKYQGVDRALRRYIYIS